MAKSVRPPIEELQATYVGKRVRDKDGITATVTSMRELTNRHASRATPIQVVLNGSIRMAWQQFHDIRNFQVIEAE